MNVAGLSIKRPITVVMIVVAVFIIGFIGYRQLTLSLLPDMDIPVIAVITSYSGTPPEEVEQFITKPIEEAAATIENYDSISSTSQEGLSVVAVHFKWGQDMNWAAFNTRERIDPVSDRLPDAAGRPIVIKIDTDSLEPVITIQVAGIEDMRRLYDICRDDIKPELEKIVGVAAASVYGGLIREIRVVVDWQRLAAYELDVPKVEAALRNANLNMPAGFTTEGPREFTIRIVGEFDAVDQIKQVVVETDKGTPIRISDIATVQDTHKEVRTISRFNGKPSISLSIVKESGANTVKVSDAVREAIRKLPDKLPEGITLTPTSDQAKFVRNSLDNLYNVAIQGGCLAIIIIFLFLSTFRGTLVVAISIPFSILATLAFMYFSGMTLNVITMGGLVLAIGRIVDDSVVVLENIFRHLEAGEPVLEASVSGTRELAMAIMGATFTDMCVFLPLLFIGGMVGTIFSDMALVVMFGLFSSLVAALTVVPMMASRLLSQQSVQRKFEGRGRGPIAWALHGWKGLIDRLEAIYRRAAGRALRNRAAVLTGALGLFVACMVVGGLVGMDFFPSMDSGDVRLIVGAPMGSSVERTDDLAREVAAIIRQIPELQTLSLAIGTPEGAFGLMQGGDVRTATFQISVGDIEDRDRSEDEIKDELRKKLAAIPDITAVFGGGHGPPGGGFELTIKGDELDILAELGEKLKTKLKPIAGLRDVDLNWTAGAPEYDIEIDLEKAGRVGLSAAQVAHAIDAQVGGTKELTKYREGGKEYDLTVRARPEDRKSIQDIRQLRIWAPNDALVPLTSIARITPRLGPSKITRQDRSRSITVTASVVDRPLTDLVADADEVVRTMGLPEDYTYEFGGTEEDRSEAFGGMGVAFLLGLMLIYIIIGSQFESLIHPFVIMLAIPLQMIGVLLALVLSGISFSIMVFLGVLMLTGMVVSNAILVVQLITLLRARGVTGPEAIVEAGARRLRPIMMTVMSTMIAMTPMALARGSGSEMWSGLATAVIGGLAASTLMTLIVVPCAYSVSEDMHDYFARLFTRSSKPADTGTQSGA